MNRIDDWLGGGIYIDADGQYPERSTGIYSRVENYVFVTMARLLNRAELLEPARKHLEMTIHYTHPDGEVETVGSRRQDQLTTAMIANYHPEYRYLAVKDRNRAFAGVVRLIEGMEGEMNRLAGSLIHFLEEPVLAVKLDAGAAAAWFQLARAHQKAGDSVAAQEALRMYEKLNNSK
ncbi:MAG: hypothetical protein ACREAB_11175 [Blastocatellia bacterium]